MRFTIYTLLLLFTYAADLSAQKVSFTPIIQNARNKQSLKSIEGFTNVLYEISDQSFDHLEFGGRFDLRLFNNRNIVLSIGAHGRRLRTSFAASLEVPTMTSSTKDIFVMVNTKKYIASFLEASYQVELSHKFKVQPVLGIKWLTQIDKNKDTDLFPRQEEPDIQEFEEAVEGSIKPSHLFYEYGINLTYRRYGVFIRHGSHLSSSITDDLDDDGTQRSFSNRYRVSTIGLSYELFR
ncbi:hypothetical protein [Neolewinella antarctica]|uniref:Outer membrane protein beta-barrel domain-containing protein n=1 Tax=Neolewinella antarctica TaxID=442734 RepID=A0ABX0XAE2_9BACT|nr:hypothetical protein [Neolewinella antarctica]NJC25924.1 hypothetical protein [Neolewinella antarctica]